MSTPHEADDINTTTTTTTTSHAAAPPQPTVQSSSEAHQSHRLSFTVALPIPHSPSVPLLTPTAEATERTNWLSAPASARTSFTRVDQTRAGTPVLEEDDGSGGGSGNASSSHISADGAQADAPHPTEPEPEPAHPEVPQTSVTFLLVSGRRRNMLFEPETTIGRVKELVWNTWPADWQDERPPAPAYLRILFRGRVLQDDDTLTGLAIPTFTPPAPATPTIMHLSIRPIAPADEGSALKKKRSRRSANPVDPESGEVHQAGCCSACIIC